MRIRLTVYFFCNFISQKVAKTIHPNHNTQQSFSVQGQFIYLRHCRILILSRHWPW
jgi:hypothetical protein